MILQSGHRGRTLLLMVTLNKRSMMDILLQNGIAINASACGGNIKHLEWVEQEIAKEEVVDISDENYVFDLERYEQRRKARKEAELAQRPEVADENEGRPKTNDDNLHLGYGDPLPNFDENSFDSYDDELEEDKFSDEEVVEDNEPDWKLEAIYERKTLISVAVNVGDTKLLEYLIELKANPLQDGDAGIRAVSYQDAIAMIYLGMFNLCKCWNLVQFLLFRQRRN